MLAEKIVTGIFMLAKALFVQHPATKSRPADLVMFRNTFPFRYALCAYCLMINWISTGSGTDRSPRSVRNHMVDLAIVAYATYFDGLLSTDGSATRTYDLARAILTTALAIPALARIKIESLIDD